MSKILIGEESRTKLIAGANQLANAVKTTLGPQGKNVIISKNGNIHTTKDGVSVAKSIFLSDPTENIGAQMLKEVASKTGEVAGDGTTTSVVLGQALMCKWNEYFTNKDEEVAFDINEFKRGVSDALVKTIKTIKEKAIPIEDVSTLFRIASISSNGDEEVAELVAKTIHEIGVDGLITIEDSRDFNTYVENINGMQIDRGYIAPSFITNHGKMTNELEKPLIVLTDKKISFIKELLPIMNAIKSGETDRKSLLVICEDMDGEALATLSYNNEKNILHSCVVRKPESGNLSDFIMKDLATLVDGVYFSDSTAFQLKEANMTNCGKAEKVIIGRSKTIIIGGAGKPEFVEKRLADIRENLDEAKNETSVSFTKKRLARLSGKVAVFYVAGVSEMEREERKDRIDDAICAAKAALEEGFIAGMGSIYLEASKIIRDDVVVNQNKQSVSYLAGLSLMAECLIVPTLSIYQNADKVVTKEELMAKQKYNFAESIYSSDTIDLIDSGVIDPAKVAIVAIENAVSIAQLFMSTSGIVID